MPVGQVYRRRWTPRLRLRRRPIVAGVAAAGAISAVVGLASGAVVGTSVVSFGAVAASVGLVSGSTVGTPVISLGALSTVVGLASGSVLGNPTAVGGAPEAGSLFGGAIVGPGQFAGSVLMASKSGFAGAMTT